MLNFYTQLSSSNAGSAALAFVGVVSAILLLLLCLLLLLLADVIVVACL